MKTFRQYLHEAGMEAGKLELLKTKVSVAHTWAKEYFASFNLDIDIEIPKFEEYIAIAKLAAKSGKTKRKDMPVIDAKDVKDFQMRLKNGLIDIRKPFAKKPFAKNSQFPTDLKLGDIWLDLGTMDGDKNDDKINVSMQKRTVSDLNPIQKQIYIDVAVGPIARSSAAKSIAFLSSDNTTYITSKDNYIIDGHHRYLASMLLNPNMKVNCLVVDLEINKLLPMSVSYGDAVGNKRNA